MKKLSVLFLSLVALATTVTSCTKDSTSTPAATALELTVKDELGTVSGATVNLYATQADLTANDATKAVATGTSDASGKVTFNKNLQAIVYYFSASKDCKNNMLTQSSKTAAALVVNTTTKMDAQIAATATLTIVNASNTDTYNIYVGDNKLSTQPFPVNFSYPMPIPAGQDYIFKAVKLSADGVNESTNPADTVTKTVNIACGLTDTFTFPQS